MKIETFQKLCCPFDKADLKLTVIGKTTDENIMEGYLTCSDCRRFYPIVKGIPIMNPDEYRAFQFEAPLLEKWKQHLENKTIENFKLIPDSAD